jgi:hypothetical protein
MPSSRLSVIGGKPVPKSHIWVNEGELDATGMTKSGFANENPDTSR